MFKIFHDPHKNPPVPPPTYLMYGPLDAIVTLAENGFKVQEVKEKQKNPQ